MLLPDHHTSHTVLTESLEVHTTQLYLHLLKRQKLKCHLPLFIYCGLLFSGTELGTVCEHCKHSTTELHGQPIPPLSNKLPLATHPHFSYSR